MIEKIGENYKKKALAGIIILACISSAIETDLYVPSLPEMIGDLKSTESAIQKILSLNFFGIFLSGLLSGPLSDKLGQRRVLVGGSGIFAIASLLCYLAPSFEFMVLGRFIQGLGAGTISTVAIATIFSLFNAEKASQITALLASVCTMMMAIAPLVGTWINLAFGWRACFLLILFLAGISWIGFLIFLPRATSHSSSTGGSIVEVLLEYKNLLFDHVFILRTLIRTAMFSCLFIYTANVSILFIKHLSVPEEWFGYYQASTMSFFCVFSLIAAFLIGAWGETIVKRFGTILFFLGSLFLGAVSLFYSTHPLLISLSMAVVGAGIGLTNSVYFAEAIEGHASKGAAIALTQGLGYVLFWGLIEISRLMFNGSLSSISILICGVSGVCLGSIWCLDRNLKGRLEVL